MNQFESQIFDSGPNPMIIVDETSGRIIDVNSASIKKYGYSQKEFLNLKVRDLEQNEDASSSVFKRDEPDNFIEKYHTTKTGRQLYVRINTIPVEYRSKKANLIHITDLTDIIGIKHQIKFHFRNSPFALIEWDENFEITSWSDKAEELIGWTKNDLIGKSITGLPFIPAESISRLDHFVEAIKNEKPGTSYFKIQLITKDGSLITTEWHNSIYFDSDGKIRSIITHIRDLSGENHIGSGKDLLSQAIKATNNGIVITDTEGIIEWVNPSACRLTGYTEDELIGQKPSILKSGKQDVQFYADLWKTIKIGKVWKGHLINRRKDGSTYYEEQTITPLVNEDGEIHHFIAVKQDISERIETEKKIRRSLKEKETLLAEIHHRVKNNLALVSSLMELPRFNLSDKKEKQLIIDTQLRIKSIATVHEKLYHNELLSEINFKDFVNKITGEVKFIYNDHKKNITCQYHGDDIYLNIREAVPCGLIVTELIINAYKYAFKSTKNGIIFISLHRQNNGTLKLTVKDNGEGIKDQDLLINPTTLGFTLIKTLADQIDAKIKSDFEGGFGMTLLFKTKDNYTGK